MGYVGFFLWDFLLRMTILLVLGGLHLGNSHVPIGIDPSLTSQGTGSPCNAVLRKFLNSI